MNAVHEMTISLVGVLVVLIFGNLQMMQNIPQRLKSIWQAIGCVREVVPEIVLGDLRLGIMNLLSIWWMVLGELLGFELCFPWLQPGSSTRNERLKW